MAGGDYRSCDVCGGKAFYDANLTYETRAEARERPPYRVGGEEQATTPEATEKYGMRLGNLGDWAVICAGCSKTHRTQIVPIPAPGEATC